MDLLTFGNKFASVCKLFGLESNDYVGFAGLPEWKLIVKIVKTIHRFWKEIWNYSITLCENFTKKKKWYTNMFKDVTMLSNKLLDNM